MGIISSNKSIGNVTAISCDGSLDVTLGITAAPDIVTNPADIVLVLDRSGSMTGQPLADMKTAVNTFIDIIAEATDGTSDNIGSGSRIGIVSFSETAVENAELMTSVIDLKSAVASLSAGGSTNHGDALTLASTILSGSTNNKVLILFTDGETTVGPDPTPIATAAKADGITIYCIGLVGVDGIDVDLLNAWATEPATTHVAIAPDSSDLDQIFADLAANITVPGATNIVINEVINPDFIITSAPIPSIGTISALTDTSFQWDIEALGVTVAESATVTFTVKNNVPVPGTKKIDQSISYTDTEGNVVSFADPSVFVDCSQVFNADVCPTAVDVALTGCEDFIEFNVGDLLLENTGRIVQLDVNLLNVCPAKRVALAVVLNETDAEGITQSRGMKVFTIPAHTLPTCTNILVSCVRFILPDDGVAPCTARTVTARFMAHYIDNDFQCCPLLDNQG